MSTPAVSKAHDLQDGIAWLADSARALERRFHASRRLLDTYIFMLLTELASAGREVVLRARQMDKAWQAAAEESRVRAAQLDAVALLLQLEAEEGEEAAASTAARALLCCPDLATTDFVVTDMNAPAALRACGDALRMRGGVDPYQCTMNGEGLMCYRTGGNSVAMVAVDREGCVVDNVDVSDVCVSVEGASSVSVAVGGASSVSVTVGGAGRVELLYHVPEGCVTPLSLSVSVCGAVLPAFPWTVSLGLLGDSAILASIAPSRLSDFLHELGAWLPGRAYKLLYRGSRDGMTAAAFHARCDQTGPTLVLVRCTDGWVFGGHAGLSWVSPRSDNGGKYVPHSDTCLFSVTGPYTSAPTRLRPSIDSSSQYLHAGCGPCFSGGLEVKADSQSQHDPFDIGSCSYLDASVCGLRALTTNCKFVPAEVEVFVAKRS